MTVTVGSTRELALIILRMIGYEEALKLRTVQLPIGALADDLCKKLPLPALVAWARAFNWRARRLLQTQFHLRTQQERERGWRASDIIWIVAFFDARSAGAIDYRAENFTALLPRLSENAVQSLCEAAYQHYAKLYREQYT